MASYVNVGGVKNLFSAGGQKIKDGFGFARRYISGSGVKKSENEGKGKGKGKDGEHVKNLPDASEN